MGTARAYRGGKQVASLPEFQILVKHISPWQDFVCVYGSSLPRLSIARFLVLLPNIRLASINFLHHWHWGKNKLACFSLASFFQPGLIFVGTARAYRGGKQVASLPEFQILVKHISPWQDFVCDYGSSLPRLSTARFLVLLPNIRLASTNFLHHWHWGKNKLACYSLASFFQPELIFVGTARAYPSRAQVGSWS
jgi:hypothetical protein